MPRQSDFDRYLQDYQHLTPAQRDALVRRVIREAHVVRAQAMRDLFRATWRPVRAAIRGLFAAAWRRYRRRRDRRVAAQRLHAMDDYMLRDIGLTRGEIEFAVSGREDPTRLPRPPSRKRDPLAALRPPAKQPAQPPALPLVLRNSCAG